MKQNTWFDPFFILDNLSEEEKFIQRNVRNFANKILKPEVVKNNINHYFDKEL